MQKLANWFSSDGRHFQIVSQTIFLIYGFYFLSWDADWTKVAAAFAGTLIVTAIAIKLGWAPRNSLKSGIVTGLGLSLLLKANSPWIFLLAGVLAIGQKYVFRPGGKHLWNPANFGIVMAILLSGSAWISPGQWGSGALLVFIIGTLGLAVLSKVKRLETGFTFLIVLGALEFSRSILYMGWDMDVWLHKMSSGSLWLFALFMITDPMTIPNSKRIRIFWAASIAGISFILSNFYFINAAPFWVLFCATPLNYFIDKMAKASAFTWADNRPLPTNHTFQTTHEK
jgi:Na+-transporting NADH:ubiquinone oxidoreductase subunit NqrB